MLGLGLGACDAETKAPEPQPEPKRSTAALPPVPLSAAFLERAVSQLGEHLAPESELLEIRSSGRVFSVQLARKKKDEKSAPEIVQIDFVEKPGLKGQPPVAAVYGPTPIELKGQGKVAENLFRFSEIQLSKMARAFSVAQLAVDPEDGKVERMVVRRFLPFSDAIRARIYVHSPRMSGSIDTNQKGIPLKR